jgi:hypothetical protein
LAEVAALKQARILAEDQTRKMAEEQMEIIRIQHELEAKKQAYSDAQKATRIDVDDAGDDDGSDSAAENQPVSYPFIYSLYSVLITLHSSIRGPQSRTRHVGRKTLANGCLKLLTKL